MRSVTVAVKIMRVKKRLQSSYNATQFFCKRIIFTEKPKEKLKKKT